jgi:uncharacterized protein YndB with AHSA1/START domain
MSDLKSIQFVETIAAPSEQVFSAFGSAVALESWFSDFAEVAFNEKGRLYCWWNVGYYASGLFTKIVENEHIAFTWSGPDEPHNTLVEVILTPKDVVPKAYAPEVDLTMVKSTEITIRHSGIGAGDEWTERITAYQRGWETALENLKSVLETGVDKRVFDRPMLGVMPGDLLDEQKAAEMGVSVPHGVVLSSVVEGMGAEAAGLQKGDIIVSLNKQDLKAYQDFNASLRQCKAGDQVEVIFYRNGEKHSVQMELSHRQIPDLPGSAEKFSESVSKTYLEVAAERENLFEGVTEAEAAARPAAESWSAKETLVHLLYTERWLHLAIACALSDQRSGGFANQLELIAAMADSYPLDELLAELKRSEQVTIASFKAIPEDFVNDKRKFASLVNNLGQGFAWHTRGHFDQIKEAIEAARQA